VTAFELLTGERQKPKAARTSVSVSVSLEVETLTEVLEFAKTREVSRSAAVRQLLVAGLMHETIVAPELRKRAEEVHKLSQIFDDIEKKWAKFVDVEAFSFYASEPIDERQPSVVVEAASAAQQNRYCCNNLNGKKAQPPGPQGEASP
jgi:hypothetical protein